MSFKGPKNTTTPAQSPVVPVPDAKHNVVQTARLLNVGGPVGAVEPIGLAEDLLGRAAEQPRHGPVDQVANRAGVRQSQAVALAQVLDSNSGGHRILKKA